VIERRPPDDPIYATKLPATGQPKELRSGLLAAIPVSQLESLDVSPIKQAVFCHQLHAHFANLDA
jgi:hypothetical protein